VDDGPTPGKMDEQVDVGSAMPESGEAICCSSVLAVAVIRKIC
jgi:hypothetical protein